jgi:hypothetical protein
MDVIVFALLVIAIGYGLERNHARQASPSSRLAGSTDAVDRDTQRVLDELRAH